jgi:hypothetical protein
MLNQSSDGLKFGIGRVENVEPSIEMIAAGHEYFGHVRPRKIEKARWARRNFCDEYLF